MNPADDTNKEPTERPSAGAAAGPHDNLEEQVHNLEEQLHDATLKGLQRTNHQSKPARDLDEQLQVSVEALLHPNPPPKPVEEVDDLLLAISHHLDDEASERKAIRNRLLAIDSAMERLASRGFRYLVALCIGVCSHLSLAILRRGSKADNCSKGPRTWLVAGGEAKDRELDAAAWLDEAAGRRKQSGTRYPNCADGRSEATDHCSRPAASTADKGGCRGRARSCRAAACRDTKNRRAARRRSRTDGARGR